MNEERLKELAGKLAEKIREADDAARPRLRLVELPERATKRHELLDDITREAHRRRIRYLAGAYRLQWLVEQACFGVVDIEDLSDEDLIQLHADMDRARECPEFDVSYEERGLVRNRA